jgi:hypothetical protein
MSGEALQNPVSYLFLKYGQDIHGLPLDSDTVTHSLFCILSLIDFGKYQSLSENNVGRKAFQHSVFVPHHIDVICKIECLGLTNEHPVILTCIFEIFVKA